MLNKQSTVYAEIKKEGKGYSVEIKNDAGFKKYLPVVWSMKEAVQQAIENDVNRIWSWTTGSTMTEDKIVKIINK